MNRRAITGAVLLATLVAMLPLRLARAAEKGGLKLADEDTAIKINLDRRGRKYIAINFGETESVPAGPVKVVNFSLFRKDGKGKWWELPSRTAGPLQNLEVTAGETTTIEVGTPLTVKPRVHMREVRGRTHAYVGFSIVGCKGTTYSNAPKYGNKLVPPPKVKIVDENDRQLKVGSFEYG
ncbi:MAG: hypothetical protein ACOCXX_04595 [Planctomycetota bacterium]